MANDTRRPGVDSGSPFPPAAYLPQRQESAGAEGNSQAIESQRGQEYSNKHTPNQLQKIPHSFQRN